MSAPEGEYVDKEAVNRPILDVRRLNRIYYLLTDADTEAHRAYVHYQEGALALPDIVQAVCLELTGNLEAVESYACKVEALVAELETDACTG